MNKKFVKIVALVLAALMVLSVASVLIYTFAGSRRSYYMIAPPAPVIENSIDGANGNLLFSFDNVKNPAS